MKGAVYCPLMMTQLKKQDAFADFLKSKQQ
jgi:hypothetical protein